MYRDSVLKQNLDTLNPQLHVRDFKMKGVIPILTQYTRTSIIKRLLLRQYCLFITPPLAEIALRAGNIDQSNCSNLPIALPVNLGHVIADLLKQIWDVDQSNCSNDHSCVRIKNMMFNIIR
jgi:hypothetical protein